MANPQLSEGYTRLANSILNALYKAAPRLSGTKIAVILLIIRATYGYQRKTCDISYRYIAQELHVSEKQAWKVVDELINRHKILLEKRAAQGPRPRRIAFNKDYDSWEI